MNSSNNAAEQKFCNAVRECGCIVTYNSQVQLHHIWGSKFKHNKIHIGNYAVLALSFDLHDIKGNSPFNVTNHKKKFHKNCGSNAVLFQRTLDRVEERFGKDVLPPQEVIDAILDWGNRH